MNGGGDIAAQQITRFLCFRSIRRQRAVEQDDIHRYLAYFGLLILIRTFRRSNEKAKNQGGNRCDEFHPKLDDVSQIGAEMMMRQCPAEEHAEKRAAEQQNESERRYGNGT